MKTWVFGVAVRHEAGEYVARVRDVPEALISEDSKIEALASVASAIELSIRFRMKNGEYLPACTSVLDGEHAVTMSAKATAKAAVYQAWQEADITKTELARRMGRDVVEVRRILEPGHGTKLDQLEEAAKALGGRLSIGFLGADQ